MSLRLIICTRVIVVPLTTHFHCVACQWEVEQAKQVLSLGSLLRVSAARNYDETDILHLNYSVLYIRAEPATAISSG